MNRNLRLKNDTNGLTGLALRIFIMVVIAGVCLVAILGFIVMSKPDLDKIHVDEILVGGHMQNTIWCNWTESTNSSAFEPRAGEHWYAGVSLGPNHAPNKNFYNDKIMIICTDNDGQAMADVDVIISGCGVLDNDRTNTRGEVELSLKGCHLGVNEEQGSITITAKYDSTFGTQEKTKSITVLAGAQREEGEVPESHYNQ